MAGKKQKIKDFVVSCTTVFKTFEYTIIESKNKANLWHFSAKKNQSNYVIYCAPDLSKVKGIIKVALRKIPKDSRFVVICTEFSEEDEKYAHEQEYSLVDLSKITNYGSAMLKAKLEE